MSSILRKAMWPAALIIGMFVLIGAVGTAKAPVASAAVNDVCDILGPYNTAYDIGAGVDEGDGSIYENGNKFLLVGNEYLFVIVIDGAADTVDISIKDQTGDLDIDYVAATTSPPLSVADAGGAFAATQNGGVDNVDEAETYPENGNLDGTPWDTDMQDVLGDWGFSMANTPTNHCGDPNLTDELAFIIVDCDSAGRAEISAFVDPGSVDQGRTENYECLNSPTAMTLTATPTTVESHPALGNVSHSLIVATITDKNGNHVGENYNIDWETTGCKIDGLTESEYEDWSVKSLFSNYKSTDPSSAAQIEYFLGPDYGYFHPGGLDADSSSYAFLHDASPAPGYQPETRAAALLHCEGADPGTYTVKAELDDDQFDVGKKIVATTEVTVVGPPAFISMVAEPTSLVCGEKSQILVTVTDALNQPVSDHTRVELITNYGGVLAGTGSSLAYPGVNPVNPLSSGAAETFGGVATAYLLTSTNHVGPYEVVAAAGGSSLGAYAEYTGYYYNEYLGERLYYYGNTGVFSTPVVTSQVTVTCSEAAPPDVTAPDTGTGTISPPNTGDAGLADSSATGSTLLVIAGAVAFVLASFASFRFVRR